VAVVKVRLLQGVLRIPVCFWMVTRGEFVVRCVADVVFWRPLFRARKIRQLFNIYFSGAGT